MAKVIALMNTIDRYEMTVNITNDNIKNAGHSFDLYITDNGSKDERVPTYGANVSTKIWEYDENIGNSSALNIMLKDAMDDGADYIAVLANDIILPKGWINIGIETIERVRSKGEAGLIGYSWRGYMDCVYDRDLAVFIPHKVFGVWFFHRSVVETVGYFAELSKYGLWDSEYNERCRRAGLINVYTTNPSKHDGVNEGDPPYRLMKNEELQKATVGYNKAMEWGGTYLSFEDRQMFL